MLDSQIGEVLLQSRKNLGKSVKEVEFDTKIRAKHIEALEADDFGRLPGSIYTQGFIKTYANYLGIDPEPLINSYKNRYSDHVDSDLLNVSSNIRVETKKRPVWFPFAVTAGLMVVLFIALLAWGNYTKNMSKEPNIVDQTIKSKQTLDTVVAGATTNTVSKENKNDNEDGSSSSSDTTTQENRSTTTSDPVNSDDKQTTTTSKNKKEPVKDGKIDITIKLTGINGEGSWAKVFVDGKEKFEGIIEDEESKLFSGDATVRVRIGNSPGMEVLVDDKKVSVKDLDIKNGIIDHTFVGN